MRKKAYAQVIKRPYTCRFTKSCVSCPQKHLCVSATGASQPNLRKYFLKLLGKREPQNEAMRLGKQKHEDYLKDIPQVNTYQEYLQQLWSGNLEVQEQMVCSPMLGLRGVIDLLQIKKENGHYDVTIIDLKSGWQNYYVLQLICYGMMERHNLSTEYFIKMGTVSKTGKTGN